MSVRIRLCMSYPYLMLSYPYVDTNTVEIVSYKQHLINKAAVLAIRLKTMRSDISKFTILKNKDENVLFTLGMTLLLQYFK